jgi:hypothetical protein
MLQDQKSVRQPKRNRGDDEKVYRLSRLKHRRNLRQVTSFPLRGIAAPARWEPTARGTLARVIRKRPQRKHCRTGPAGKNGKILQNE